ncbi:MAG: hypothetical protein ABSH29_26010 [Acidimicrobiales bacterium]
MTSGIGDVLAGRLDHLGDVLGVRLLVAGQTSGEFGGEVEVLPPVLVVSRGGGGGDVGRRRRRRWRWPFPGAE